MTEIPEHLLKRSRERRAALGLGGDAPEGGAAESAPAAPASGSGESTTAPVPAAAAATPAPVEEPKPEPPKPVPAYVQAAYRRRRVPYWAMPVLAGLVPWAYVFATTLEPPPVENDPMELGGEVYTQNGCSGCHGTSGEGASAPGFADGAVVETFPDYRDQMMWVRVGAKGWPGQTYGAEDVADTEVMPDHPGLSDQELAQVVLYERRALGDEPVPEGEDQLLAIANGEMTFEQAGLGPLSEEVGIPESKLAGG